MTPVDRRIAPIHSAVRATAPPWRRLLAVGVLVAAVAPAASAADVEAARAFVQSVYAPYSAGEHAAAPVAAAGPSVFAAPLLALIREDQRRAQGEAGVLDFDPVCNCQDFDKFAVSAISLKRVGAKRMRAVVRFVNGGRAQRVELTLVVEGSDWRIADVRTPEVSSLLRFLKSGLAQSNAGSEPSAKPG